MSNILIYVKYFNVHQNRSHEASAVKYTT